MMRSKVGFEFEVGHIFSRQTLKKRLKENLTAPQFNALRYTNDYSIWIDTEHGQTEIITAPLPEARAMKLADRLMTVLTEIGCKTNISTGLHVNVSVPKMYQNFNPFALLAQLNEAKYLKRWQRENNQYARPWEDTFLTRLKGRGGRHDFDWVSTNDYDKWKRNCNDFMADVCGCSDDRKNVVVEKQIDRYEEKRISVSIPYAWQRGYVEYRIIGGNYLGSKRKALTDIQHFIDTTKYSVEYEPERVENYMHSLYRKCLKT